MCPDCGFLWILTPSNRVLSDVDVPFLMALYDLSFCPVFGVKGLLKKASVAKQNQMASLSPGHMKHTNGAHVPEMNWTNPNVDLNVL